MHQDDIVTTNAKGALFIPATSRLSWREYRSRLCKVPCSSGPLSHHTLQLQLAGSRPTVPHETQPI